MATVNRYTQTQENRYTPRTLQELMLAPAYKRGKHDELDASISEYETALAQFSGATPHEELLQKEQKKVYDQMIAQRDKLNSEGFSQSAKSDFLRFNKEFQQSIGPAGTIGKINEAKADLEKKKEAFYKDGFAKGHSKSTLDDNWQKHNSSWKGFDESGNISKIDELGASLVFDVNKDVKDWASALGETQGVNIDNIEVKTVKTPQGEEIAYFDKKTGLKLDNNAQLQSLSRGLIADYTNPNTSRGQFAQFTGLGKEEIAGMLNSYLGALEVDKQTLDHTATPINTSNYTKKDKKDEYGNVSAISVGQRMIADNAEDLNNKINAYTAKEGELKTSAVPGAPEKLAQVTKEKRKLQRLSIQADNAIKDDPKLNDLASQRDKANDKFAIMETEVIDRILEYQFGKQPAEGWDANTAAKISEFQKQMKAGGYPKVDGAPLSEKARFLYDRLNDARNGDEVTETADVDKLLGNEDYTQLNEMSSLKHLNNKYEQYRNDLKTAYIKRQGVEETEFVSSSSDTEDKYTFNNLKKVLNSVDFNIKYVKGMDTEWDNMNLFDNINDDKHRDIRRQVKDLIATSTDQEINFGVNDNGDPVLNLTVVPQKDSEIVTKYRDKLTDKSFDGSQRFTAEVPLVIYNNRNVPELTDFAMHVLSSTTLTPEVKAAITKSVMTAGISVTSSKETLGETMVGAGYLGRNAVANLDEKYDGIDFFQSPDSNNAPIVPYKIKSTGEKEKLLVSDVIDTQDPEAINLFIANSGTLPLYINYAQTKTVGQMLRDFQDVLPEEEKNKYEKLGNQSMKVSEYFANFDRAKDPTGEKLGEFYQFITKLPLLLRDVSGLVDVRLSIK